MLAHQRHDLCPDPDPRGPSDRPDRHPDPVLCDGQENRADERGRCPDYVPDFFSPVRLHHVHLSADLRSDQPGVRLPGHRPLFWGTGGLWPPDRAGPLRHPSDPVFRFALSGDFWRDQPVHPCAEPL